MARETCESTAFCYLKMNGEIDMVCTVKGIAASDGIGIAKAYTLVEPDLSFEKKKIDDPAAEYD